MYDFHLKPEVVWAMITAGMIALVAFVTTSVVPVDNEALKTALIAAAGAFVRGALGALASRSGS